MAITIKGRVKVSDNTNSGVNYHHIRVQVYATDSKKDYEFLEETYVKNGACYSITIPKNAWNKMLKKYRRKPLLFVLAEYWNVNKLNQHKGFWIPLYQSKPERITQNLMTINPRITVCSEKYSTQFLPSKHGWKFGNAFDNDLFQGKLTVGKGLCGGMVFSALDRYNGNKIPDGQMIAPKKSDSLFKHLYHRQIASFNKGNVISQVTEWIEKADESGKNQEQGVGYLTSKEMKTVKQKIRAGKAVPIVLVRQQGGIKPFKATDAHQVLIYKYVSEPALNRTRLWIYDPDNEEDDEVVLTVYEGWPRNRIRILHSDQFRLRERGFFINKAYEKAGETVLNNK